jgi:hypothetical protein
VLLIQLKRFSYAGGFWNRSDTPVIFPTTNLDLTRFVPRREPTASDNLDDPRTQIGPFKYDLYGVTNHSGTLSSGHCKSPIHLRLPSSATRRHPPPPPAMIRADPRHGVCTRRRALEVCRGQPHQRRHRARRRVAPCRLLHFVSWPRLRRKLTAGSTSVSRHPRCVVVLLLHALLHGRRTGTMRGVGGLTCAKPEWQETAGCIPAAMMARRPADPIHWETYSCITACSSGTRLVRRCAGTVAWNRTDMCG